MSNPDFSFPTRQPNVILDPQQVQKILNHPINQKTSLVWENIHSLQELLYPDTSHLQRNILVANYLPHNKVVEHDHHYFEILYVHSGSCTHHVEKQYSILNEGDLCILPPGMKHYILHADNAQIIMILIKEATLKSLFTILSNSHDLLSVFLHDAICKEKINYFVQFHTTPNTLFQNMLSGLQDEMYQTDEYSDRLALIKFSDFLLHICRTCKDTEVSSGESILNQNQQILSMIYEQYATITLSQLAEKLHYSIPYCSKYLKKNMGSTFSELLQRVRFQKACDLLLASDLPVNQIGKSIGYETPENFFRAFKKTFGVTPSQYRKNGGR